MKMLVSLIDRILNLVLVSCLAGLVMVILWQVASRYLLNDPSSFTEEAARFLLIWICLLGSCYAFRTRSHLGLNILTQQLNNSLQLRTRRFVLLIVILFAALVLVTGGTKLVWLTLKLQQTSAAMGIPMAYIYSVLPASGVLFLFYSLHLWNADTEYEGKPQ